VPFQWPSVRGSYKVHTEETEFMQALAQQRMYNAAAMYAANNGIGPMSPVAGAAVRFPSPGGDE